MFHLARGHVLAPVLGYPRARTVLHYDARGAQHAVHTEEHLCLLCARAYMLRHGIADARAIFHLQHGAARCRPGSLHIGRGRGARALAFCGHIIYKVVHMHHIAAGKNARHARLHIFVHHGAAGAPIHADARLPRQLVFRNKAHA